MTATATNTTAISKLLLNAWSAEFALRIKPISVDRDYLNTALNWVFPQAYFAVLFSARAVLAIDGIEIANPESIERHLNQWAHGGLYGPEYTRENNPFEELMKHRISVNPKLPCQSSLEAAALHIQLTEKVNRVASIHETYILNRMGADFYQTLIETLPSYLKDGFVGHRATILLSAD